MSQPVIEAWYLGQKVYLGLGSSDVLVFDGNQFVRPQDADYVMLVTVQNVTGDIPGDLYPESNDVNQISATWNNRFLCKVIGVTSAAVVGTDVETIVDPNNGQCVCGISCAGTDLQYIQVTTSP